MALLLSGLVLLSTARIGNAADAGKTRELVGILKSDAGLFEKARACQQLGEIGTPEAVPALAGLLADEHLSAYARSGLEGIGGNAVLEALRAAVSHLQGKQLAGVVNSLGVRRDEKAIPLLSGFATNSSPVAAEALLALGRIGAPECVPILRRALAEGPAALRGEAAAACLLAAENRLREGDRQVGAELYDLVRNSAAPANYRLAATRGAILARSVGQEEFLVEQLRSQDRIIRNAALITIREIASDRLADALNREVQRANPELKLLLLTALLDCHNPGSLQLLRSAVEGANQAQREIALKVLARIGVAADADIFLKCLLSERTADEQRIALEGLRHLEGPELDAAILKALASARDSSARVKLIQLLDDRAATTACDELLKQARDPDAKVSLAAWHALKSQARPTDLPTLIQLTRSCQDESVRQAAENAVSSLCMTMGDSGAQAILTELRQADHQVQKNSWVRVLTSLGFANALPFLERLLEDADPAVADNVVEQLGQWPDPAPIEALFPVAEHGSNAAQRRRALASAIKLAGAAAEEHQRPDKVVVSWFERANSLAVSAEDKRLIISDLGGVNDPGSLRLLTPYLQDQQLHAESAVAILQIAPSLSKLDDNAKLKQALERIASAAPGNETRQQAAELLHKLGNAKDQSLFDGQSLTGWEGDTNVWRVRNGVIVGGSMAGNPRNEFLTTTRTYTNFVLRLEYKLTGTEGFINSGVQFHSVRTAQPPNEMSGYQADIGAGFSGCLYDESRRNRFLARASEEQVKRLERAGDWNRYEVRCEGSHIQIFLNGEKTVDYGEADPKMPHNGLIGLQIHGGSKAEVCFRNLFLQELQ